MSKTSGYGSQHVALVPPRRRQRIDAAVSQNQLDPTLGFQVARTDWAA